MATDYEQFYKDNPNGLGRPTQEFVDFFNAYDKANISVLDIGCGQGRDALFIARLGHRVTGIDLSPTGVRDLLLTAKSEGLNIEAFVADIRKYKCTGKYEVIVIDRTLHMLTPPERIDVLNGLLRAAKNGSYLLIADERQNLPAFKTAIQASKWKWYIALEKGGFLFVQRA